MIKFNFMKTCCAQQAETGRAYFKRKYTGWHYKVSHTQMIKKSYSQSMDIYSQSKLWIKHYNIYYSLVLYDFHIRYYKLDIICVTYFLTSIICLTRKLAICVRYGKWCQCFLSKLWILCETIFKIVIYVKNILFPYYLDFFWFSKMIYPMRRF